MMKEDVGRLLSDLRLLCALTNADIERGGESCTSMVRAGLLSDLLFYASEMRDALHWIGLFADIRSKDESKVFARVNRGALRTISAKAFAAASGTEARSGETGSEADGLDPKGDGPPGEAGDAQTPPSSPTEGRD